MFYAAISVCDNRSWSSCRIPFNAKKSLSSDEVDDELGSSQISLAQLSSNKLTRHSDKSQFSWFQIVLAVFSRCCYNIVELSKQLCSLLMTLSDISLHHADVLVIWKSIFFWIHAILSLDALHFCLIYSVSFEANYDVFLTAYNLLNYGQLKLTNCLLWCLFVKLLDLLNWQLHVSCVATIKLEVFLY